MTGKMTAGRSAGRTAGYVGMRGQKMRGYEHLIRDISPRH